MSITCPPTFLEEVNRIIHDNLGNEAFSVEELSQQLSLSNSQVYRKIKQLTGCSPSVYIRSIRLEVAHKRIEETELTLSIIADQVGFKYLSYFSRCFLEQYGHPPSSLRD